MRTRAPRALAAGVLAATLVSGASVGVASAGEKEKTPKTVVAVAGSKGPFTVFAPTNDAFAQIPRADLDALLGDEEALTSVLTYHVVPGKILAGDLQPTQTVQTVQGEDITIEVADDGTATITDANGNTVNITATDLTARNGVVHVIDGVLTPAG